MSQNKPFRFVRPDHIFRKSEAKDHTPKRRQLLDIYDIEEMSVFEEVQEVSLRHELNLPEQFGLAEETSFGYTEAWSSDALDALFAAE
jgi:hypothetical protein